ncbi:hypothetical protein ES707_19153 [subsurface metagenome]
MFNITLRSVYTLNPENKWMITVPITFTFNNEYYLELEIIHTSKDKRKQIEGRYRFAYFYGNTFIDERFLNSIKKRIVKKEEPEKQPDIDLKVCLLSLEISDPLDTQYFIIAQMSVINNDLINTLLTSTQRKTELIDLTHRFLTQDYQGAIKEAGIFGEYIAKEFLKKLKKQFTNFNSAIKCLTNFKKTSRSKINYNYIGNLLHPIYYVRNEAMHPDPEISLNEITASIVLKNLSGLIKYISINQIKI